MPNINADIIGIAGEVKASPEIKADFFCSEEMTIPQEETPVKEEPLQVEDWRTVINRALMSGLTGDEIRQMFRNRSTELTEEMNAYLNKYEGLIGTVFVDSHVLEQGFPVLSIPKKYTPYHRFAINCKDIVLKNDRHVEGGFSGELESFLDNASGIVEKTTEVCRITGLPVLKKGMFNEAVIDGLLEQLGVKGQHGQKALQDALRYKVMGIYHKEDVSTVESSDEAKNVLRYNLKESLDTVPIASPTQTASLNVDEYNLTTGEPLVEVQAPPQQELDVKFWNPSKKEDVQFIPPPRQMAAFKLTGDLRWTSDPSKK